VNAYRARLQRTYPDCWPWISLARRIPGKLTDEESSSLFRLARARPPAVDPVIVDMGIGSEKSSLLLAAGLRNKTRPRLFTSALNRRALKFCGLDQVAQPLAEENWNCPIDILLVHGTDELLQWSPFVKPRGIVIVHGASEQLQSPAFEDLRIIDSLAWATKICATGEQAPLEDPIDLAVARQQDYIRRASGEIAEARHAIQALKNSWSWKLTAPLRWAMESAQVSMGLLENPSRLGRYLQFASELRSSGLFDERYYRDNYAPTPWARINPVLHYLLRGTDEGANPNELFDVAYYVSRYPEVAASGLPPAIHYLRHGAYAGLDPHPYFDSSFYLEQNPDVRESGLNPLAHYLAPGIAEGRDPNPWFDTSEYLEQNPDVATFALNPLTHQTEFWSKRMECSR
jgi:hypothetical protein